MTDQARRPSDPPPPDPELRRLDPLIGTWTAANHTRDSVLGRGVPVTSTETFRWLDGGYFLVQEYETVFGDEPAQRGINFWCYDSESRRFRIMFFSNNGPFTEEGNRYEGVVAGGRVTFVGPARFQYALDENGMIQTNSDGTLSVEWWLRDASGGWQRWMHKHVHKDGCSLSWVQPVRSRSSGRFRFADDLSRFREDIDPIATLLAWAIGRLPSEPLFTPGMALSLLLRRGMSVSSRAERLGRRSWSRLVTEPEEPGGTRLHACDSLT